MREMSNRISFARVMALGLTALPAWRVVFVGLRFGLNVEIMTTM